MDNNCQYYLENTLKNSPIGNFDGCGPELLTAIEDTMHLSAGGGIVIDSRWEDECRECYTEIAAIVIGHSYQ